MPFLLAYIGTIVAANWLIQTFGVVPVGFGFFAPAGVLAAGLAFTLRDLAQESVGRWWTLAAIGVGAVLSLAVSAPFVAVASATAFLVSELADFAIYTPLRERGWLRAVFASNLVGLVTDSALFLYLAFGDLTFLPGQMWAKLVMTLAAVAALALVRQQRRRAAVTA